MNRLSLKLAAAAVAATAYSPMACQAGPILLFTESDAGFDAPIELRCSSAGETGKPGKPGRDAAAAEALVWLLLTGGAGIIAFAHRGAR